MFQQLFIAENLNTVELIYFITVHVVVTLFSFICFNAYEFPEFILKIVSHKHTCVKEKKNGGTYLIRFLVCIILILENN